jgi:NACalpha-BTF3-like transcription factor
MQLQQQVASILSQLATAGVLDLQEVEEGVVEAVEESGLESKDIDLVMSQAGCSRVGAIAALKENIKLPSMVTVFLNVRLRLLLRLRGPHHYLLL